MTRNDDSGSKKFDHPAVDKEIAKIRSQSIAVKHFKIRLGFQAWIKPNIARLSLQPNREC